MLDIAPILRLVVSECAEDYVGLWSIAWQIRASGVDSAAVMETTLSLVTLLITDNSVVAGEFEDNQFVKWLMPAQDAIVTIRNRWLELGRDPDIGEVVWFTREGR